MPSGSPTKWSLDDGSHDRSAALLRQQYKLRPDTRVVLFGTNAGQHMAIMAGFEACAARASSLWMPTCRTRPRKSPRLLAEMDQGHDYVGSIRRKRQDNLFRTWPRGP